MKTPHSTDEFVSCPNGSSNPKLKGRQSVPSIRIMAVVDHDLGNFRVWLRKRKREPRIRLCL